ncbi:MAG: SDR family oxidoreductase [Aggregatilineales bacterium]
MPEVYVVTGGAGFIGSHLVERLLRDGHTVRVVDNLSTGRRENLAHLDGFAFYQASVTDRAALDEAFAGADYVLHQAGLPSVPRSIDDPLTTHDYNATGTLIVLQAARAAGVRRVVYAASSSAYGDAEGDYKDESTLPDPLSPYAVAKLTGEYYCRVFTMVYGLETVALRYFNVFGPRQDPTSRYAAVIPLFITAMLNGQPPVIYGDGHQSRDFTYVDNVVEGNLLAVKAPAAAGRVLNLATGQRVTLLELVDKLNALLGTSFSPVHDAPRPGDVRHSRAAVERARALLGYTPPVDFDTGLARTLAWYQARS